MYPIHRPSGSVILREFRPDDAAAVAALVGDDRVVRWLSFDPRSRAESNAMLRGIRARAQTTPRSEFYLAVALPDEDTLIGFARLALTGVRAAKLGYAIVADHWGRGYGTDAARGMLDLAFGELCLHRVSAAIGPDNAVSIAVVDKLGMKPEGRIRDHVFTHGAWRDSLLYAVLAAEWTPTSTSNC